MPTTIVDKPFGLAVPDYSELGIKGPYFGDLVWNHLKEDGDFEYVPIRVEPFPDGSEKVTVGANVRERCIYFVHSLYAPPARHVMIGAEALDDLYRSEARRVIMIEPYNPYNRQDKRLKREPISAKLVAHLYEGPDNKWLDGMYVIDPHFAQLPGFYNRLEPLPMTGIFGRHLRSHTEYDLSNAVAVSPDAGAVKNTEAFASNLGLPIAIFDKRRLSGTEVEVKTVVGDVRGRDCYIRDDVVSTGGTVVETAQALRERGARRIYVCGTHLGLYGNAKEKLRDAGVYVVGTNSVPHEFSDEDMKYIDMIDTSPFIAAVIREKSRGGSLSRFFDELANENHKN